MSETMDAPTAEARARRGPVQSDRPADPDVELLVPADDVADPLLTVLVPAMNEELTIADFVAWCHEGIASAGVVGEILIVDSSADRTAEIALAHGARVLRTPRRGLGRAYIDAIPYVRGAYVVMGDADCTYDFRELAPFVQAMIGGNEFAMGSRYLGSIEDGAMPALHRYLGTPVTTWILNRVYGSHFSDIHCGMRGITKDALVRMGLASQSWEYASEMVLKSVRMGLSTVEVPVNFYKDREGRLSHHKRAGWRSPFSAAWINLRAMFVYKAEYFALKPGLAMLVLGLAITLPLAGGPIRVGRIDFNLFWMVLGVMLATCGLWSFFVGCLAQVSCDYSGRARRKWFRLFRYSRAVSAAAALVAAGLGLLSYLLADYVSGDFHLPPATASVDHLGLIGVMLVITGFSTFCFTLALHATSVRYGNDPRSTEPPEA